MSTGPRIRVGALVLHDERVLLLRQQKDGRSYWLLPGGGVEDGEPLADALRRELAEECGVVPLAIDGPIALVETIPPPEVVDGRHILHMIFAVAIEASGAGRFVSTDAAVLDHAFVERERLDELELRPPIHAYLRAYRPGDPFVALGRMWVS